MNTAMPVSPTEGSVRPVGDAEAWDKEVNSPDEVEENQTNGQRHGDNNEPGLDVDVGGFLRSVFVPVQSQFEADPSLDGVGRVETVEHDGARPGGVGGHRHRQREDGEDQFEDCGVHLASHHQTFLGVNNKEVSEHQVDAGNSLTIRVCS